MAKIYFDTTPLIYFLDDEKPFSDKVAEIKAKYSGVKGMDSIHLATSL